MPIYAGSNLISKIATGISSALAVYAGGEIRFGGEGGVTPPPWSPYDLFLPGDQGGWWDFDDDMDTKLQWCIDNPGYTNATFLAQFPNHTLFQDSEGTTAVTAVEQSLGLVLDKSGKGNHRTQATAASRPAWSARKNLLTRTEDFSNAVWGVFNGAKIGNTIIDGVPCMEVSFDATLDASIEQNLAAIGVIQTLNVRVRAKTTPIKLRVLFGGNDAGATVDIPLAWTDLQGTANGTANANAVAVRNGETVAKSFYIATAQCEYGSTATTYQRVTTATDYNAIGFPKGCKFDGVDDGMATASVDFTATNRVTTCNGFTKLSEASSGSILCLGDRGNDLGSFEVRSSTGVWTADYLFSTRGSVSGNGSWTQSPFAAPITNTLTYLYDGSITTNFGADKVSARVDGAPVSSTWDTGNSGTDNFSNLPFFFGSRSGTSLFFTGVENQSFVINRPLTTDELDKLEQFIATKSGAVL